MFNIMKEILDYLPDDYEYKSDNTSDSIASFPAFVIDEFSSSPDVESSDGQVYDNKYNLNFYILNLKKDDDTNFEELANKTVLALQVELKDFSIFRVRPGYFQIANRDVKGYYIESAFTKTSEIFKWQN